MDVVYSVNRIPIRLTGERWLHIVENHDDLAGYYDQIPQTLEDPDVILKGYGAALIALRQMKDGLYLCVVYKEVSKNDGFIITAYFTPSMKKEMIIWRKQF